MCVTGHEQLCETPQWVGLSEHDGAYAEYLSGARCLALAESERLSPIPLEFESLDRINEVYARMKKGQIAGRAVMALTQQFLAI